MFYIFAVDSVNELVELFEVFKNYKSIDKEIIVKYDIENPERFVIKSENEFNYGSLLFMIIVSLIAIFISIYGILGFIKWK